MHNHKKNRAMKNVTNDMTDYENFTQNHMSNRGKFSIKITCGMTDYAYSKQIIRWTLE